MHFFLPKPQIQLPQHIYNGIPFYNVTLVTLLSMSVFNKLFRSNFALKSTKLCSELILTPKLAAVRVELQMYTFFFLGNLPNRL